MSNEVSPSPEGPVTVMVCRRIRRGRESEYEAWLKGINKAAAGFSGFLGVNVIRPSARTGRDYVSIFRFDSYANLRAWQDSKERQQWLEKIDADVVESEARTQEMTGLEFWFTAPDVAPSAAPPRYKMVIVLVIVIFCMLNMLAPAFSIMLNGLEPLLRSFIVITTQVILMTYLVMPLITRLLSRWLFVKP
jgi:antibiotic biosynthesis monooxygenase (ABM) superfamily enzyme